jgi:hypothetical protein
MNNWEHAGRRWRRKVLLPLLLGRPTCVCACVSREAFASRFSNLHLQQRRKVKSTASSKDILEIIRNASQHNSQSFKLAPRLPQFARTGFCRERNLTVGVLRWCLAVCPFLGCVIAQQALGLTINGQKAIKRDQANLKIMPKEVDATPAVEPDSTAPGELAVSPTSPARPPPKSFEPMSADDDGVADQDAIDRMSGMAGAWCDPLAPTIKQWRNSLVWACDSVCCGCDGVACVLREWWAPHASARLWRMLLSYVCVGQHLHQSPQIPRRYDASRRLCNALPPAPTPDNSSLGFYFTVRKTSVC